MIGIGLLGITHLLAFEQLTYMEMGMFGAFLFIFIFLVRSLYFPVKRTISEEREKAVYIGRGLQGYRKSVIERGLGMIGFEMVQLQCDGTCAVTESLKNYYANNWSKLIIVEQLPASQEDYGMLRDLSETYGARLCFLNDLKHRMGHSYSELDIDGVQYIVGNQEPLGYWTNRAVKRGVDVIGSVLGCALMLPIMLLVMLIHRIQSPGPIFFSQERVGLDGEIIKVLKFRSMHANGDEDADRRFAGGNFLRKFSLDEIPQLWNVLRGEMSLIGPRPHKLEEDTAFREESANYTVRRWVKPGMTGLAQVRGYRGEITHSNELKKRVSSDMYYIEHWSLALDLMILCRTALVVLFPHSKAC